jgi:hypothetical protein
VVISDFLDGRTNRALVNTLAEQMEERKPKYRKMELWNKNSLDMNKQDKTNQDIYLSTGSSC